jgi:PII-like signaling protein
MLEVSLFLDEDDLYQEKRSDEYIMRYLMHHGIMGASVFSATLGYGRKHHLNHRKGIGVVDEGPIMIVFIDEESKVRRVLPHIKEVMNNGLITAKRVELV